VVKGGLYCPPCIPAGICRNLVNSQNSGGINFGTMACQIDQMIPAECETEFTFRRNRSRNHMDGMTHGMTGTESGSFSTTLTTPSHTQIDHRCLPTINLGIVNNPKPYFSPTTTIVHTAHPTSPHCHPHQRPPPSTIVTHRPQRPLRPPMHQERHRNRMPLAQECCHVTQ